MELQDYERRHRSLVRQTAAECTVLLKKDGSFPLPEPCRLALFGNGARRTVKGGTGSGEVNSHFFTSVEEGLKRAGFTIVSEAWLDAFDALKQALEEQHLIHLREAFEKDGISGLFLEKDREEPTPDYDFPLAFDAEAAVYVLSRNSGEGSDRKAERGDFLLTDCEMRDIRFLARHYPKFMLVLNVGGVLDLGEIIEELPNVLLLSQLGVATGTVTVELPGKPYMAILATKER